MPDHYAVSAVSPSDTLRAALMHSLVAAHRPELADLVASAELDLDFPGLWLRPYDSGLNVAWLAGTLWAVAVENGLPLAWIRVLPEASAAQGREA